jgi:hypothetical protein
MTYVQVEVENENENERDRDCAAFRWLSIELLKTEVEPQMKLLREFLSSILNEVSHAKASLLSFLVLHG